jgi:hypothetical protein
LGVGATGQPPAHQKKGKLLKSPLELLWIQLEEEYNIIVKWAQEDVETSYNLLNK